MSSANDTALTSYRLVRRVVTSGVEVDVGMDKLLKRCDEVCPSSAWEQIRKLDFNDDVRDLQNWLAKLLAKEKVPKRIKAFWFGIFNPIIKGRASCGLDFSGSVNFDANASCADWAVSNKQSYLPRCNCVETEVLKQIYRIVQGSKRRIFPSRCKLRELCSGGTTCWHGEYVLCLGYAALAVQHICRNIPQLLSPDRKPRAVAVGYNDGDSLFLGHVNRNHFVLVNIQQR